MFMSENEGVVRFSVTSPIHGEVMEITMLVEDVVMAADKVCKACEGIDTDRTTGEKFHAEDVNGKVRIRDSRGMLHDLRKEEAELLLKEIEKYREAN